jgi:hypothetical protein
LVIAILSSVARATASGTAITADTLKELLKDPEKALAALFPQLFTPKPKESAHYWTFMDDHHLFTRPYGSDR